MNSAVNNRVGFRSPEGESDRSKARTVYPYSRLLDRIEIGDSINLRNHATKISVRLTRALDLFFRANLANPIAHERRLTERAFVTQLPHAAGSTYPAVCGVTNDVAHVR